MPKPNPTLNQMYANSAQVVDLHKALELAEELASLSSMFNLEEDKNIRELWKLRAFLFLNRACELACVPVHRCVAETGNGLEDAWFTYDLPYYSHDYGLLAYHRFLGYCSTLTESQARMRALS